MSGIPAGAGQLLGKRLGKYEILALLALGGTAEIYLARIGGAAGFEKYVVVKCLHDHLADDAEFVKMFLDEARLAAHLDHSNIVQTMELGQHEGRYYMVMEFLAGLSLAMIVRRAAERLPNGRIPVPLVLNVLAQSCAGLHYAHEKAMNGKALNIVHRDISPQNLVISFEGVVKLVDFGIAKAELRETRTRSGTIKGKFAYMSPEQCVANNVDRRTDVFALGVIAHELLTGQRLFKRPSPYETYQAVIECNVKPPSAIEASVDPSLDPVIMRAIAKDKADRYPTAEAFGDALLGYLHHRGIGSGPGDVSRFFDTHCAQEIEEHSGRMRELISGRDVSVDTGVNWGADDPEDDAKREAPAGQAGKKPAGAGDKPRARDPGGGDPANRSSAGSLSMVIDELGGDGARADDGDELPADRTRIESNPLGQLSELDQAAAMAPVAPKSSATPAPRPSATPAPRPSATPAPSPVAPKPPPSGALPLPPAPKPGPAGSAGPPGMPPSGRFPELANLPTMIAEPDADDAPHDAGATPGGGFLDLPTELAPAGVPPPAPGFANAPTALAPPIVPPAANSFANAPTALAVPGVPLAAGGFSDAPTALVNPPPSALAKTQIAPGPIGLPSYASPNGMGYPVMNAQMSAQIATGATVFPSDHRGNQSPPAPLGPPGVPGPMFPHNGNPVDLPHGPPHGSPHGPPHGSPHGPPGGMPGPPHPDHLHWGAMASRMRAAPPWMLAVLFVGALGVALLLTIVIAKIIR